MKGTVDYSNVKMRWCSSCERFIAAAYCGRCDGPPLTTRRKKYLCQGLTHD